MKYALTIPYNFYRCFRFFFFPPPYFSTVIYYYIYTHNARDETVFYTRCSTVLVLYIDNFRYLYENTLTHFRFAVFRCIAMTITNQLQYIAALALAYFYTRARFKTISIFFLL